MAAVVMEELKERPDTPEKLKEQIERFRKKAEVKSDCISSYFEKRTFERLTSTQIRDILPDLKSLKMDIELLTCTVEALENLGRGL